MVTLSYLNTECLVITKSVLQTFFLVSYLEGAIFSIRVSACDRGGKYFYDWVIALVYIPLAYLLSMAYGQ